MLGRELLNAVKNNQEQQALTLLEQGASTTAIDTDYDNYTPLHYAVQNGNFKLINALIEKGANQTAQDRYKRTPIFLASQKLLGAVKYNRTTEAKAWMNSIALTTATDSDNYTPLHLAVKNGNFELINALIEKGASLTATDRYQRTPIDLASQKLLDAVKDNKTTKALAWMNSIALTTAIDTSFNIYTPLHWAVRNGNFKLINALIEKGANQEAQDIYQRTPIDLASKKLLDVVKTNRTIEAKAWMNSIALTTAIDTNHYHYTPLHWAVMNGNFELIIALIEKGANQTALDSYDRTPIELASKQLLDAVKTNKTTEALAWINSIALTTAKDSYYTNGYTPLHYAAHRGNFELINALIDKGASQTALDSYVRKPNLDAAVLKKVQDLALLKEPLFEAVKQAVCEDDAHTAIVLAYLDEGVIPSYCQPETLSTPLHLAAINKNILLFERMKYKANMMARDASGRTPQDILISGLKVEMLAILVSLRLTVLNIIQEYDYDRRNLLDTSFISQYTKITAEILEGFKAPLTSTAVTKFKTELEKAQSTSSLTVPKMVFKLNQFLTENQNIFTQLILPLDGFIRELSKHFNLEVFKTIKDFLENKELVLPTCVRDFKTLYQTMRSTDGCIHLGEGFLSGKEHLSDEQFLEKVVAYIHANTQSQTASCWEIACKYENKGEQLRELHEVKLDKFKPAFSFLRKSRQEECKIDGVLVPEPQPQPDKKPSRVVTVFFAPPDEDKPAAQSNVNKTYPVVQRCAYPLSI